MSFNRQAYDTCNYASVLAESLGPGEYVMQTPVGVDLGLLNDTPKGRVVPQGGEWVQVDSELRGLNFRGRRRCDRASFGEGPAVAVRDDQRPPREDTLISNPPSTLRERGVNRFECLPEDPQARIFEWRVGTDVRTLTKDQHVPCLPPADSELLA